LLAFLLALTLVAPSASVAAADVTNPDAARVIAIAEAQAGDPWVAGSTGPRAFDCSGLVFYAFKEAGLLKRIGGSRRTASGYLHWFKAHGRASRVHPKPGDLVIWGGGEHVGIYVGNGKAVSALTSGVRVHKVKNTHPAFTTYLHVKWPAPEGFKL
jgi:cell wall-associated NlpC family hydrolase